MDDMFLGIALSTENYDALLKEWSNLTLQNGVTFDGGLSNFCNSEMEKQKIIDNFGWTITDGGKDCTSLGVDDELLTEGLKLYPNPVADVLTVDSKLPLSKVEIYSILGQKEKEINAGFSSIQLNSLLSGFYIIKIYSEKGTTVRKLIKQ